MSHVLEADLRYTAVAPVLWHPIVGDIRCHRRQHARSLLDLGVPGSNFLSVREQLPGFHRDLVGHEEVLPLLVG